ncbi:unnamed protein product, partial [Linum tenue]
DPRSEFQRGLEIGDNPKGCVFYHKFLILSRSWICASDPSAASLPAGRIFHIPVGEINESPCLCKFSSLGYPHFDFGDGCRSF